MSIRIAFTVVAHACKWEEGGKHTTHTTTVRITITRTTIHCLNVHCYNSSSSEASIRIAFTVAAHACERWWGGGGYRGLRQGRARNTRMRGKLTLSLTQALTHSLTHSTHPLTQPPTFTHEARPPPSPSPTWPLHDIAITYIVWCMAQTGRVGDGAYIAQWSCNSITIGYALGGSGQ